MYLFSFASLKKYLYRNLKMNTAYKMIWMKKTNYKIDHGYEMVLEQFWKFDHFIFFGNYNIFSISSRKYKTKIVFFWKRCRHFLNKIIQYYIKHV